MASGRNRIKELTTTRKTSEAKLIFSSENLVAHIFKITNNEKQFPKAYRYTLVTEIRNACLNYIRYIIRAGSINPKMRKDAKRRTKYYNKARNYLEDVGSLILMANKTLRLQNPEQFAVLFADASDYLAKTYKYSKSQIKRLPTKKEYEHKMFCARLNTKLKYLETDIMRQTDGYHDDDGFLVLVRQ